MNSIILLTLRSFVFATAMHASVQASNESLANRDAAASILAETGRVQVSNVGRYVSVGTLRVHVSAKLGRPEATFPDGTWIYENRRVNGSAAEGTLVLRFDHAGRVASMMLVTPAVAMGLRAESHSARETQIATRK